jgi:peptidoglycan/LPS O-acetylase OafA/YrhL
VPSLDGLRGAGIAVVIGVHYFGYPRGGYFSMDMFFALSGFLITTLLLEERDRAGVLSLRAFYGRRAYRLLPALFTLLAAYAIANSASPRSLEQIAAGGMYATNVVMASGSHFLNPTPLTPLWSLAQEEQFYLLWPLALVVLLKRGVRESRIAAVLIVLLVALVAYRTALTLSGASLIRVYCGPDTHADGLVLGCLLALLRRQGFRIPQLLGWIALTAFAAAFVLLPPTVGDVSYGLFPMSVAGTLLVGAALDKGALSACLSCRPLVWLGVLSYSLYLWHDFVLWLLAGEHRAVALALTLGAAALCYYKVEKPLRKHFRARPAAPPEALPAPSQAVSRGQASGRSTRWALPAVFATRITGQ